jgi:hypothetical protein
MMTVCRVAKPLSLLVEHPTIGLPPSAASWPKSSTDVDNV